MRSTLREVLPSMFHRRLLLLLGAMLLVLGVLGAATTMLATGQTHREARAQAESKLSGKQVIQTKRGAIYDRYGRVLAEDKPGWELAIHYDLMTGKWARKRAFADASSDKLVWGEMSEDQRETKVAKLQGEYEQQSEVMLSTIAQMSGTDKDEIDQRITATVRMVKSRQQYLWEQWRKQAIKERGEDVPIEQVAKPIKDQLQHHVVLTGLSDRERLQIETFIEEGRRALKEGDAQSRSALPWTMVELRRSSQRRYPQDRHVVELDRSTLPGPMANAKPIKIEVKGVGLHLIGLMRDIWAQDVKENGLAYRGNALNLDGYTDGDKRGRSGVEQSMEDVLRGSRGLRVMNLDTGETTHEIKPRAGADVRLTIDIDLQARIQAIMSPEFGLMKVQPWQMTENDPPQRLGAPLHGAAVVIDVASGDVLAAVTMPEAPRSLLEEDPSLLWQSPINQPMLNRALQVAYRPGSTVKPLVLAAAISDGVLGPNEKIDTPGFLWKDKPLVFRDWYWKKYTLLRGEIDGVEAIEVSSNPFFGLLAERLIKRYGRERLPNWFAMYGLGEQTGIGLKEESKGVLAPVGRRILHNETCFMAIGQGVIDWTPLQAATAYMGLASGDPTRRPRLIVYPEQKNKKPYTGPRYKLDPAARKLALEGMYRSANNRRGTTHHISAPGMPEMHNTPVFNVKGVKVMAKSGTADPGNYRWIDFNGNNKQEPGEHEKNPRDHAWVIALVQPEGAAKPTHAIACVVEYAGSGGKIAGPVVNQIIHALQHHQYLDWPPAR